MNDVEVVLKHVDEFDASLWEDYCVPKADGIAWARVLEVTPIKRYTCRVRLGIASEVYEQLTAGLMRKRDIERAVYDALHDAAHDCLDRQGMADAIYDVPLADYIHPSFIEVEWCLTKAFYIVSAVESDEGEAGKIELARKVEKIGDPVTLFVRLPESLRAALNADDREVPLSDRLYSIIIPASDEPAEPKAINSSAEFDRQLDDEIPF